MGAPFGNQNAVKAKRWQQAIDRALDKRSRAAGIEELDRLAEKFLDTLEAMGNADKPSIAGYAELADRMDGKAAQPVETQVEGTLELKWQSS